MGVNEVGWLGVADRVLCVNGGWRAVEAGRVGNGGVGEGGAEGVGGWWAGREAAWSREDGGFCAGKWERLGRSCASAHAVLLQLCISYLFRKHLHDMDI